MGGCGLRTTRRLLKKPPLVAALVLVAVLVTGCSRPAARLPPQDPRRPVITVTSFDFPESETLAEIYTQALRRQGYPAQIVPRLGPRDIVQPALEQGRVDLVPGYLGSSLDFLSEKRVATADARADYARLRQAVAARGLTALAFAARAENRNGFVVTGDTARTRGLRRLSDLRPIAHGLILGGPPECPERPRCLIGLRQVYGLEFKKFESMVSRRVTADALAAGEINVGMLETTDGNLMVKRPNGTLIRGDLIQLADDRHLQPAENIVPMVRNQLITTYGPKLVHLVDAVTSQLTTGDLIKANARVEQDGATPAAVAAEWLRDHPLDQ